MSCAGLCSDCWHKTEYLKTDYRPRLLSTSGPPAGLEPSANPQQDQCFYLPLIIGYDFILSTAFFFISFGRMHF